MAKTRRQKAIDKLDAIVTEITFKRDGNKCVVCGGDYRMGNGHVFSRRHYSVRWDVRPDGNCHPQCGKCNIWHNTDAVPYFSWYQNKFGMDRFNQLHDQWRQEITHFKDWQLEEMYEKLKAFTETDIQTGVVDIPTPETIKYEEAVEKSKQNF
jgi:hypothetical protein